MRQENWSIAVFCDFYLRSVFLGCLPGTFATGEVALVTGLAGHGQDLVAAFGEIPDLGLRKFDYVHVFTSSDKCSILILSASRYFTALQE